MVLATYWKSLKIFVMIKDNLKEESV